MWRIPLSLDGRSLLWSTMLGGSGHEGINAIAASPAGKVAVTGWTMSPDFPVTPGTFDTVFNADGTSKTNEPFLATVSGDTGSVLWATFLNGSSGAPVRAGPMSLGFDGAGNVYVGGTVLDPAFPVTPRAYDETLNGESDIFVSKFSPDGSTLLYSTFLGSYFRESGRLAVRENGDVYLFGGTTSDAFPTTPGAFDPVCDPTFYYLLPFAAAPFMVWDAFVAKLVPGAVPPRPQPPPVPPSPPDTRGPRMLRGTPEGILGYPVAYLTVRFDEPVDGWSLTAETVRVTGPQGPIPFTGRPARIFTDRSGWMLFIPEQTADGVYTVVVGPGVLDTAGNPLDQDGDGVNGEATDDTFTFSFTIDQTAPRAVTASPTGTVQGPVSALDVVFSEPVDPISFRADDIWSLTGPGGRHLTVVGDPVPVDASNVRFRISFSSQTAPGTYTLVLGIGIRDLAGNYLDSDPVGRGGLTASFTIVAPPPPPPPPAPPADPADGLAVIPRLFWPTVPSASYGFVFGSDWRVVDEQGKLILGCDGLRKLHTGVDIHVKVGSPVYAAEAGIVRMVAKDSKGWQWWITIEHTDLYGRKYTTSYLHLAPLVRIGQSLSRGEKIATTARLARARPHLHFHIRRAPYHPVADHGALPRSKACEHKGHTDPVFREYFVDPRDYTHA